MLYVTRSLHHKSASVSETDFTSGERFDAIAFWDSCIRRFELQLTVEAMPQTAEATVTAPIKPRIDVCLTLPALLFGVSPRVIIASIQLCDANLRNNAADLRLLCESGSISEGSPAMRWPPGPPCRPIFQHRTMCHDIYGLRRSLDRFPHPLNDPGHRPLGGCCARGGMRKQNGIG